MLKILMILLCHCLSVLAFIPQNFNLPVAIGGHATFVDFTEAQYYLTYDVKKKSATYRAIIHFTQQNFGKPVFDVVNQPKVVMLEQDFVREIEVTTPLNETKVRIIDQELSWLTPTGL